MADIGDDNYTLNDKKFAVVMVIDVSGSMAYQIEALSTAFNRFIQESRANSDVRNAVDIAVITFGSDVRDEFNGFCDISSVPEMHFSLRGSTNMTDALELANQMARDRTHLYARNGITAYKPWIMLMTDGFPDDPQSYMSVAQKIKQREADGKLHTFVLGMGDGFNRKLLQELTNKCFAITDWDFSEFFSWLGKSLAVVSTSTPGGQGAICDVGEECQDMTSKFFDVL